MNALGLQIATWREIQYRLHLTDLGVEYDPNTKYSGVTLGAFRRGKSMPWVPGAEIDVWTACFNQVRVNVRGDHDESVKLYPHCYFIQTIGGHDGGHVFCPSCRVDVIAARTKARTQAPVARPIPVQGSLF